MGVELPLDGCFEIGGQGIRFREITDGLSNTLLVGEKHVPRGHFGEGWLDNCTYNGNYPQSFSRAGGPEFPLAQSQAEMTWSFGSYHMGLVQFTFADGSVRPLQTSINPRTLGLLASRNDHQPMPDY
jgi:prepilin-type processing-associated H-X9-DG protein